MFRFHFTVRLKLSSEHSSECVCYSSCEDGSDVRSNDSWKDKDAEHDADGAAAGNAAVAVDLAAHGGTHKLLEHLARVKREGETAYGRGAEWVLVGLIASITNWISLSVV